MTLEEKAENYIIDRYKLNECYREDNEETREYMRIDVHSQYEEEYQLYLAGLHEGQPKWHDLRKNPNDIPQKDGEYILSFEGGKKIVQNRKDGDWTNAIVKPIFAWYELPQF